MPLEIMVNEQTQDSICLAMGALEPFGFDTATLVHSEDTIDLSTANSFVMLRFRNVRGDFMPQAGFIVPPQPHEVITELAALEPATLALLSSGYQPALIGWPQTPGHVELWVDAIVETMPDFLRGDYRRVKGFQAAHYRRVKEWADAMRLPSNIPDEVWDRVLEYERSHASGS